MMLRTEGPGICNPARAWDRGMEETAGLTRTHTRTYTQPNLYIASRRRSPINPEGGSRGTTHVKLTPFLILLPDTGRAS
jgi:hypothetical protein